MMDIRPLQIQNPVVWNSEYKFFILRLVMFGAFYPNYFTKTCISGLEAQANRVLLGRDPMNTVYMTGFSQEQAVFGELYAEQVKRIFRPAIADEDQIKLSFDGSNIFVEFDRSIGEMEKSMSSYQNREVDRNLTGDVSSQVYVSVKLRHNQPGSNRHSVRIYNPDVAQSKYQEWQETIKLTSESALTTDCIEQVSPPAMSVTSLTLDPVHISSPSVFWIQYGDGVEEKDARLQEIISSCLGKFTRVVTPDQVKRAGLYIAPYKDVGEDEPCYYRARVNSVTGTNVTVFFIDYGNMAIVHVSELLVIP